MAMSSRPDFKNLRVGISVSESADLGRLGFSESHLRLALGEIARTVLVHGGSLVYGGHLLAGGYTPFLVHELERYGHPERPLLVCLPYSEHALLDTDTLTRRQRDYGLYAKIVCLDLNGHEMSRETGAALTIELGPEERKLSLTGMRRYLAQVCSCRVLLGGKLRDYQGNVPGIIEEALIALTEDMPLLLAGGFGGATIEILRAMNPKYADWLPQRADREWTPTPEVRTALSRIAALWTERRDRYSNVLKEEQIVALGMTHRPSEVATLVGQALNNLSRTAL
jgi:hypothetical protein